MINTTHIEVGNTDRIFSILADQTRRVILHELAERDGANDVSDLMTQMVDTRGSSREIESLEIRLRHMHLPKMAEAGVIDYDESTGQVRLTPVGRQVEKIRRQSADILSM